MRSLSKSKLLAYRQCQKRLWLEVHRPDLWEDSSEAEVRGEVGREVGEIARRVYDPNGLGVTIDVEAEGVGPALARSAALLGSCAPIFESGFAAEGAVVFTDIMLPVGNEHSWRMVEVKSTTGVKAYHRDDVAIQAFIVLTAGVRLKSVALAHINGKWVYPGDENYQGLLVENDLTEEAFERAGEVRLWIEKAHAVAGQLSEPQVRTGAHCSYPFECGFRAYCESEEPLAKYPIEWLPRLRTAALKEFIETNLIEDLRHVPDDYLSELQQRVKAHTISGSPFFDQAGAAAELAHYKLPAYFLDFETSQCAVPIWKGTRPYQQIPFQFSRHRLSPMGELDHSEFLDLSGDDPSRPLAEFLIDACDESGPVFVYNASFESARIKELADRFPELSCNLLGINQRMVDLLPIARRYYYHPSQCGSWALKWVIPTIAADIGYDKLTGVHDGSTAMTAYLEAIQPKTASARKDEIRRQLLDYCGLDTYALVRLWQHFAGRKDLLV